MTFVGEWQYDSVGYDHRPLPRFAFPQRAIGGAALAAFALACAWTIYADTMGTTDITATAPRGDRLVSARDAAQADAARRGDRLVVPYPPSAADIEASLFDSSSPLGYPPATFGPLAALQWEAWSPDRPPLREARKDASVNRERVAEGSASSQRHGAPQSATAWLQRSEVADAAPVERPPRQPSYFEKLFGKPVRELLAYASPDDGAGGGDQGGVTGRYGPWTAVYDISAHTVYLPDGRRLEAHSGLGRLLDDPRYADAKNRGVTPPDVYDLELREGLFHGVRALRLIPVDSEKVFGRSGLLAHTYMLGPRGDSNGCVSFKNYTAFLRAYLDHEVRRLVVVAHET